MTVDLQYLLFVPPFVEHLLFNLLDRRFFIILRC